MIRNKIVQSFYKYLKVFFIQFKIFSLMTESQENPFLSPNVFEELLEKIS